MCHPGAQGGGRARPAREPGPELSPLSSPTQNFVLHLQPNDGSTLFAQDSTFCPQAGNNGQGMSFQSVNFAGRFLRTFQGGMYLAGDGINTGNPWDTSVGWTDDTSWLVQPALAPAPQSGSSD